jgi:hypothetical protein
LRFGLHLTLLLILTIAMLPMRAALPRLAVMDLDDVNTGAVLGPAAAEIARGELRGRGFLLVERGMLNQIIAEQCFCASELSRSSKVQFGRLALADAVVTGSVTRLGSVYAVNLRAITVPDGIMLGAVSAEVRDVADLAEGVRAACEALASRLEALPGGDPRCGAIGAVLFHDGFDGGPANVWCLDGACFADSAMLLAPNTSSGAVDALAFAGDSTWCDYTLSLRFMLGAESDPLLVGWCSGDGDSVPKGLMCEFRSASKERQVVADIVGDSIGFMSALALARATGYMGRFDDYRDFGVAVGGLVTNIIADPEWCLTTTSGRGNFLILSSQYNPTLYETGDGACQKRDTVHVIPLHDRWHLLKVTVRGPSATIYLDGKPMVSRSDLKYSSGGIVLAAAGAANARIDDVTVTIP